MKHENGWWIDDNENRWSDLLDDEDSATKKSVSMNDCSDCSDCSYCRSCSKYKKNPQRIVSSTIGSRGDTTTIYWISGDDIQVVCGCFRGDLSKFREAITKTHNEESIHRKNYLLWLDSVQAYIASVNPPAIEK